MEIRIEGFAPGAHNMARDAELLAAGRPSVRLYGWAPACVSLGYAQDAAVVDIPSARRHGVDVVRRPTGGGALLHDENEVTYAIVVPRGWVPADPRESYRMLSWGVLEGLRRLGVPAEFSEGHGGAAALCYLREEGISIVAGGRRLSGGAQKRTKTAVLQHGTVLVTRDARRTAELLGGAPETIRRRTVSLAEIVPGVPRARILRHLRDAFADAWTADGFRAPPVAPLAPSAEAAPNPS